MADKKTELFNVKQEIIDIVGRCNKCGLCKAKDSIYLALKDESFSPRGLCILLKNNNYDKFIFEIPLTGICREVCPLKIDLDNAIRMARQVLNVRGKPHQINESILEKLKKNCNPYS